MARLPSLSQTLRLSIANTRHYNSVSSPNAQTLQNSIETAIKTNNFQQIPHLLSSTNSPKPPQNSTTQNPFSFLSSYPQPVQIQIIDQILQSFIPLRPRSLLSPAYSLLLSYTLQKTPNYLPLTLAVLQSTLRSGSAPPQQTRLSLSVAWLDSPHRSIIEILAELRDIGYSADRTTCNYLLSSLCAVDQLSEAVRVLRGLRNGGCEVDSESYGTVIAAACRARRTETAAILMREMVGEMGVTPKQGTVANVVAAMRANGEAIGAVEMVDFLEREGCGVGFQSYEMVAEGCLERGEFVAAGKVLMEMAKRGFIPYIGVRLAVVEGLSAIGEREIANAVRQSLVELKS